MKPTGFKEWKRFFSFLWNERNTLYTIWKEQDTNDLVLASTAFLSRNYEKMNTPFKFHRDRDERVKQKILNPKTETKTRNDEEDLSFGAKDLAVIIAAATIAGSSDSASASTPDSSDTFSAGGGDFSGGGSDASY
jgi:uncharacterized membrane protein YgcG